jgi:pimeloyl-ACP methyl ester carboxylesterase
MQTLTSKDGTTIAFEQVGKGKPVILVGGSLDSGKRSHAMLSQLATLLSKRFTVFTYDRRGRGESSDTLPYSVEREIEDIEALIEKADGSAFLYGFSSGAALALRAAAILGNTRVTKLVLFEPPYGSSDQEKQAFANYVKQTNKLLRAKKFGDAVILFLSDMLPADMLETMRQSPEWSDLEALAPTLVYDNAVMGDDGLVPVDITKTITNPTLVLYGSATLEFMREAANALTKAIPHASQKILEGQDHAGNAEAMAPVLVKFFKSK